MHCLKAGTGKSLLPCVVGDAQADLVRLDGHREPLSRDLWLMVHPDLRTLVRIKVTVDWISETIGTALQFNTSDELKAKPRCGSGD